MTVRTSRATGRSSQRRRITASLLAVAQLGHAHWFFGNLYEAIVKVPDRLAAAPDLTVAGEPVTLKLLLRPGSPVRYYLPVGPVAIAAGLAALLAGWDVPSDRRRLATASACAVSGGAITVHLVRAVNIRLFFADRPLSPAEQKALLGVWYRWNAVRLVAVGGAWLAWQGIPRSN